MKLRKGKRILAIVLAALMVIGLIPANMFINKTKAATSGTIDLSEGLKVGTIYGDTSILKLSVLEDMAVKNETFTVEGVEYKTYVQGSTNPKPGKGAVPTDKCAAFKLEAVKDCSVTFVNKAAAKTYYFVEESGAEAYLTDTAIPDTLTFEMKAGRTYYYYAQGSKPMVGEISYKVSQSSGGGSGEVVTTEHTFDAEKVLSADENYAGDTNKKKAIPDGYKLGDFFVVSGDGTIRGNSGTYSVEVAKAAASGIKFTITGTADVSFVAISTGGSNTSAVALVDANGNVVTEKNGLTTVTGTSAPATFEYTGLEAGTYQIVSPKDDNYNRGARILSAKVIETTGGARPERKDWASVEAPKFTSITEKDGVISITYKMLVDYDGADSVKIVVRDASGKEVESFKSTKSDATLTWTPEASGNYMFYISAQRENESDKVGAAGSYANFVLPLKTPVISLAYNKGNGSVSLTWAAVDEATSYVVEYSKDGKTWSSKNAGTSTEAVVSGLTIGTEYQFRVVAKRGEDSVASDVTKVSVVAESQTPWGHIVYGNGANANKTKVTGDINKDGKVTLESGSRKYDAKTETWTPDNQGKWVPATYDGLQFYYTTVPTSMNFTLRAKVTVDEWILTNGQEAFGLMANDKLGGSGWNNSYSAFISKCEYYWDGTKVTTDSSAQKVTHKLGIGAQEKIGCTLDNIAKLEAGDTATVQGDFKSSSYPLEQRYPDATNVIGNGTNVTDGTITEMYMTIQKNNTGYFVTYESVDGSYKMTKKYYDTEALSKLDKDNVYVGFFVARNGKVTFSDVSLTTIDPSLDAPAEERPKETLAVNTAVQSSTASGNSKYEFIFNANCDGMLTIKDAAGKVIAENVAVKNNVPVKPATVDLSIGKNSYVLTFTPDANYTPDENTVMESYEPVEIKHTVTYAVYGSAGQSLWVAPDATGKGTKDDPMSIYDAVKYVQAGQTIVLKGGTYNLQKTVKVERGVNGTADAKIYMIADPDATSRPVFDFGGYCAGMILAGDYWVFKGFDVTKSADGQKGIQVSGDYNLLDSINTYANGNTGIQISRYYTTDLYEDWPAYNTILNCSSYGNADKGYEDADGFAAKLTVADGNVFDGCIAHHNADDGWDLFAKVQTGAIGSVTIKNCVAYANGYTMNGGDAGNGNGFKMGGDSMTGKHVLMNSVAYDNKAKGIDSNSCPDIIVKDCISFNNGSYNVALYTNLKGANTDYDVTNVISFRYEKAKAANYSVGENIKLQGTQDQDKVYKDCNYFWDAETKTSVNKSGAAVALDWFKNLDTSTELTRNADGSINMNDLLVLTDKAPAELANAGMKNTASTTVTVPESIKVEDVKTGDSTPIAMYAILALLSIVALGGVAFFGMKKRV